MQYARAYINKGTGEIDHLVVSDAPLTHDHLGQEHPFDTEDLTLEDHPDKGLERAKDLRSRLEVRGGRAEFKPQVPARERLEVVERGPKRGGPAPARGDLAPGRGGG